MNALYSLLSAALLALSTVVHAAPPPIEQAPADVQGYIHCIQEIYAANRWQAGTIAGCRASNPAVRSLKEGDYVSVTFTRAQSDLYEQSRKQWIDFDKALRGQLLSKKLGELFQAANSVTAYSFQRVASDLDARFAELNEAPFSWYPATKTPYTTVNGLSLASLHNVELAQFTRCLEDATARLGVSSISRVAFDNNATACSGEIAARNSDSSKALFQPQAFSSVVEQAWTQIASQQARTQEAERLRLAKEEAESWPNRIKALLKQAFIWVLVIGGLFIAWTVMRNRLDTSPEQGTGRRRRERVEDQDEDEDEDEDEEYEYRQPRARKQAGRKPDPGTSTRTQTDRKPDLGTFTLKHRRISALTTKHLCASCTHWTGQRIPHPVNNDVYVKLGAVGKCVKQRAGSPHGMKRHDEGFYCKDYSDMGY